MVVNKRFSKQTRLFLNFGVFAYQLDTIKNITLQNCPRMKITKVDNAECISNINDGKSTFAAMTFTA